MISDGTLNKSWHHFQIEEVLRLLDVDVTTGPGGRRDAVVAVEFEKWIRFGHRRGEHPTAE